MGNRQPRTTDLIRRAWLALLLACLATQAPALDGPATNDDLLDPDAAFAIEARLVSDEQAEVSWTIAPGYYLYRDRIRFSTDSANISLGAASLPDGTIKDDEFFGKIATYRNRITATVPVQRDAGAPREFELQAVSQGCADIGVCYPPHTQTVMLAFAGNTITDTADAIPEPLSLADQLGFGMPEDDFLDPDVAFKTDVLADTPTRLLVRWTIADGYYLYRDKFSVTLAEPHPEVTIAAVELPAGETKHDEFFGDVQVFHHEAVATVTLARPAGAATDITLQLAYQGCAEAGICYPPIRKQLPVALPAVTDAQSATVAEGATGSSRVAVTSQNQDEIARVLADSSLSWIMLFFFGAGVLLAFTACMYPMIPIISSIIVGQGASITAGRAFLLTLVYVEAVAVTYAVIGVISAQLGAGVQAFFQNPVILSLFALVFVLLALSMFGFYNLQLPASLQAKLSETSNRMRGGTLLGVAVMGVLSALIVGPCAGPVLIGALIYTSQSGDLLKGALAMFALGNGLGAPLLVICTSGGKLLPRAGGWMDTVKAVFGVILLGVAVLMLERILPGPMTLVLWALLLIVPAVYMGALDSLPPGSSGWRRLWKGLGIAMLVYGVILIIGAATGARDVFNPLRNLNTAAVPSGASSHQSQHLQFTRIKTVADLEGALAASAAQGRTAMLDFYADWCTYCIKMEDYTFSDSQVQAALADTTLLQADVTASDAEDLALLNRFGLFAPPAILFFDARGEEIRASRLVGFRDAEEFLAHLEGTFAQ